ncbi:unnamed protein product [Thelazia callipaeda]|uniref:MADF domain-containing protein n=1 Tax=Thelazia callipaeda TaxID=103827 RepID=A0A0N5D2R4_THECL|nr:unnamed protein product [Thelazia callipaeda]
MNFAFFAYLQLQLLLLFWIGLIRGSKNESIRVISIVENFSNSAQWEFHSKSVRRVHISKKTWEDYLKYKEQTCRLENENDAESKAKGYLNWEEMAFHKSLRLKLLPHWSLGDPLSYEDAVMLSNVDSRLLLPEPESLCKFGLADDNEHHEVTDKSRFEDTLISRQNERDLEIGGVSIVEPCVHV